MKVMPKERKDSRAMGLIKVLGKCCGRKTFG